MSGKKCVEEKRGLDDGNSFSLVQQNNSDSGRSNPTAHIYFDVIKLLLQAGF